MNNLILLIDWMGNEQTVRYADIRLYCKEKYSAPVVYLDGQHDPIKLDDKYDWDKFFGMWRHAPDRKVEKESE